MDGRRATATGRRSIAGPMSHSRGYLGGESPLGARGCWGRSHKRPQPPKAYFKISEGAGDSPAQAVGEDIRLGRHETQHHAMRTKTPKV